MSPHNNKKPIIISSILLLIACFIFIFLFKKIQQNNAKAKDAEIKWQTEANQRQEISSLDTLLENITNEKTQLESHFAQGSDIVPYLNNIEELGTEAKVVAQVSSVDTSQKNMGLVLSMKATGSFEAIYKFITLLENSPYALEFISVNIEKDAGDVTNTDSSTSINSWTAILKVKLLSFVP